MFLISILFNIFGFSICGMPMRSSWQSENFLNTINSLSDSLRVSEMSNNNPTTNKKENDNSYGHRYQVHNPYPNREVDPSYHGNNQMMRLHTLKNTTIKCNDGSEAGYYYRRSKSSCSRNWLIFLEGGWYCFNDETCNNRAQSQSNLFSSNMWFKNRQSDGIMSTQRHINSLYHNYNMVYIPYCSSDLWTGEELNKTEGVYFHGSLILDNVIEDLMQNKAFKIAKRIVFAGSSAGGIGVMMNIDRLAIGIRSALDWPVQINGIVDSAWFLDNKPYIETSCTNILDCPPDIALRKGIKTWKSRIPSRCLQLMSTENRWRCFLGYEIYKTLQTPVFIVQSIFDDAQLRFSKVPIQRPGNKDQLDYIGKLGLSMQKTLESVEGVFAYSCVDHEVLTKSNWAHIAIGNVTLLSSLRAWNIHQKKLYKDEVKTLKRSNSKYHKNISKFRRRNKCRNMRKSSRKRRRKSTLPETSSALFDLSLHPNLTYHLIDSCSRYVGPGFAPDCAVTPVPLIPQCNPSCTAISHPMTGIHITPVGLFELYNVPVNDFAVSCGLNIDELRQLSPGRQIAVISCNKAGPEQCRRNSMVPDIIGHYH